MRYLGYPRLFQMRYKIKQKLSPNKCWNFWFPGGYVLSLWEHCFFKKQNKTNFFLPSSSIVNRQTDENFFNWNYQENIFFFFSSFHFHFLYRILKLIFNCLPAWRKVWLNTNMKLKYYYIWKVTREKRKKQMCCTTPAICTAGIRLKQSSKFSCITFSNWMEWVCIGNSGRIQRKQT